MTIWKKYFKRKKTKQEDIIDLLDALTSKGYYCDMQIDSENYTLNVCNREKKLCRRTKKESKN